MLRLGFQQVSDRMTPPPFDIESHEGKFTQGYEQTYFVAPGGQIRWDAWDDPRYVAIAREAMAIVERNAVGNARCNAYFATKMPKGRSFDDIWNAEGLERVRVSFSPGPSGVWRAATYRDTAPFEWAITETTVLLGAESVASAMVHEATRTNGIGPEDHIAYGAESACNVRSFILTKALLRQMGWLAVKQ